MIQLAADNRQLRALLVGEPSAARLLAHLDAYGTKYPFCRFYLILQPEPVGAVCLREGGAFFWLKRPCDELTEWLQLMGAFPAAGNLSLPLPGRAERCGKVFAAPPSDGRPAQLTDIGYRQAYALFSIAFANWRAAYVDWYPEICHHIRHNTARLVGMDRAAALLYGVSAGCVVVGLLAAACKRQGRGSALLREIVRAYPDKTIIAYSAGRSSDAFYLAAGWRPVADWYEYE